MWLLQYLELQKIKISNENINEKVRANFMKIRGLNPPTYNVVDRPNNYNVTDKPNPT